VDFLFDEYTRAATQLDQLDSVGGTLS